MESPNPQIKVEGKASAKVDGGNVGIY